MSHPPIATNSAAGTAGRGGAVGSFDEASPELLEKTKAYLECRSRGVDPLPPLDEAWEDFYDFYAPRIRAFVGRWVMSDADRNDCLQDVWHEVVARLGRFDHDPRRGRLSTWLLTLARNKAIDAIRRRNRHASESLGGDEATAAMDPGPDPAAAYERNRTLDRVRGALARLSGQVSPTSFQVVYLRWIEGRPTAEVAAALALTPGQVRFRTHRMKRKLRRLIERSLGSELDGEDDDRWPAAAVMTASTSRPARNTGPGPASHYRENGHSMEMTPLGSGCARRVRRVTPSPSIATRPTDLMKG